MSYSTTNKCCLTCAYWEGIRAAKYGRWETLHNVTTGQCRCKQSMNPGATHGSNCPKYVNIPAK